MTTEPQNNVAWKVRRAQYLRSMNRLEVLFIEVRAGILPPSVLNVGERRRYIAEAVDRLKLSASMKRHGFHAGQIASALSRYPSDVVSINRIG